ncbi:MAG: hypothetical protein KGL39_47965 [Patescibacteria group bacterium]|nr:hypothetical protein [Patescibacteria group bacterium]
MKKNYPAIFFILGMAIILCLAAVPISNLVLQTDMNAGGHSITNIVSLTDTNGNPIVGSGGTAYITNNTATPLGGTLTVNGNIAQSPSNTTNTVGVVNSTMYVKTPVLNSPNNALTNNGNFYSGTNYAAFTGKDNGITNPAGLTIDQRAQAVAQTNNYSPPVSGVVVITNGVSVWAGDLTNATTLANSTTNAVILVGNGTYYTPSVGVTNLCTVIGLSEFGTVIISEVNSLSGWLPLIGPGDYENFTAMIASTNWTASFFGQYSGAPANGKTMDGLLIKNIYGPQVASDFIYNNYNSTSSGGYLVLDGVMAGASNGVWDLVALVAGNYNLKAINCNLIADGPNPFGAGSQNLSHCFNLAGYGRYIFANNYLEHSNTNSIGIYFSGTAAKPAYLWLSGNTFNGSPQGGTVLTNIYLDAKIGSVVTGRGNVGLNATNTFINYRSGVTYDLWDNITLNSSSQWVTNFTGSFTGNGSGITNLNASYLSTGSLSNIYNLSVGQPTITGTPQVSSVWLVTTNYNGDPVVCNNHDFTVGCILTSGTVYANSNILTVAYSSPVPTAVVPISTMVNDETLGSVFGQASEIYLHVDYYRTTTNGFAFETGNTISGLAGTTNFIHFHIARDR